jgi:hypothetical protein
MSGGRNSLRQDEAKDKAFNNMQREYISAERAESKSVPKLTYFCNYCYILGGPGFINSFESEDLYVQHVVKKHKGWPAFHGPADIEKFRRTLSVKGC